MGMPGPQFVISDDVISKWFGGDSAGQRPAEKSEATDSIATKDISNIPNTNPHEAEGVQGKYRSLYTDEDIDKALDTHAGRQDAIDSSYTNNPDEWNNRYRFWDWNLAQDNPRGNLNGKAYTDTLFRSRLADALNNRRHLKPTDIGHRTLHMGATGTGADQAGSERWEPIETQEMRQMRANERLDEKARGYDIDRQKAIEDYPLELRKMMDKTKMEVAKYATTTGIDVERMMQKAVQAAEYSRSWDTFWQTLQTAFTQEYGLNISERIFTKLASIKNYPLKQMYAYYKRGMKVPTKLTETVESYLDKIVSDAKEKGADDLDTVKTILGVYSLIEMLNGNATAATFDAGFDR